MYFMRFRLIFNAIVIVKMDALELIINSNRTSPLLYHFIVIVNIIIIIILDYNMYAISIIFVFHMEAVIRDLVLIVFIIYSICF